MKQKKREKARLVGAGERTEYVDPDPKQMYCQEMGRPGVMHTRTSSPGGVDVMIPESAIVMIYT